MPETSRDTAHRLSFDHMAELYDETRTVDPACFESALDFLTDRFPPRAFPTVFYPGIGTGRIAIPLAKRGYRITGLDLSRAMLDVLRRRVRRRQPSLPVSSLIADAAAVPFPNATFDLAITVHFLHIVRDWQTVLSEIVRVVRPGGTALIMYTGYGTEIPMLNARYTELCAERGHQVRRRGIRSTGRLADCLHSLGCTCEWIEGRWQWRARARLGRTFAYMSRRAYSFTSPAPDDVHAGAIQALHSEFGSRLATEVEVPNEIRLALISLP